jgi:hypothetical protein
MNITIRVINLPEVTTAIGQKAERAKQANVLGVKRVAMALRDSITKFAHAGHPEHPNVISGKLGSSIQFTPPSGLGIQVSSKVGSNALYAPYVEFGHSQEPGRYVPAIGKRLVASSVKAYPFFRPGLVEVVDSGMAMKLFNQAVKETMGC